MSSTRPIARTRQQEVRPVIDPRTGHGSPLPGSAPSRSGLTRADVARAAAWLASRDADLGRIHRELGPPPLWGRKRGFACLVRIILEQQVSLVSARAVFDRLVEGVVPFTPARFIEAGTDHLRTLGLTRQKAAYCVGLAEGVNGGQVDLEGLARLDDEGVRESLTSVRGIGPWTADIYLLMALRRPDVWPTGDIALINTVRKLRKLRKTPTPERLAVIAEGWRPFRAVAARMLWQHYLAERSAARKGKSTPAIDGGNRRPAGGQRPGSRQGSGRKQGA